LPSDAKEQAQQHGSLQRGTSGAGIDRSEIFPRDPNFADKVGPILDLYERVWERAPLGADDYVISADIREKGQMALKLYF
jgi:hypothetical protein